MEFSSFVSIDGNNSLKHLGTSVRGVNDRIDSRNIFSDRWLTPEEVDRFKDEVKPRVSTLLLCLLSHNNFDHLTSNLARMMLMMIGKMLRMKLQVCDVLTGGVMQGPRSGRKCSRCSRNPESLLLPAATD
jgi:hypothetical protein